MFCCDRVSLPLPFARAGNELTSLDGIGRLHHLRHLEADANRIADIGAGQLEHLPLVTLRLRGNRIRNVAHVGALPRLQLLDLSENALDSLGGIDQHHFLSTLLVAGNAGLFDLQQLAVLQTLPRLATLDLTGCPLQRVEHYRERVIYMLPTLTSLDGQV
jgi:Leucine-rich repeat (LRR) protein